MVEHCPGGGRDDRGSGQLPHAQLTPPHPTPEAGVLHLGYSLNLPAELQKLSSAGAPTAIGMAEGRAQARVVKKTNPR